MTQKGLEVLNSIVNANVNNLVKLVVVGRDKHLECDYANEIIKVCKANDILYKERTESFILDSEYAIAVSWRWIIQSATTKLIILHDSLLPKYRGFAPLVNMLCNGEDEIGATAIFATNEYDTGEIIFQSSIKITYPIKISDAIKKISFLYSEIILKIFSQIEKENKLISVPQIEKDATYSLWRDEEDYFIDWSKDSISVLNFINALSNPYKGAASYINGIKKIRILEAELENDVDIVNRDTGKVIFVLNNYPVIVCGKGLLKLTKVVDDKTNQDLLPFNKFRIRLTSKND